MTLKNILSFLLGALFTMFLTLVIVAVVFPFEAKDYVTYFGTTDKEISVSWDPNDPAPERYEVSLKNIERDTMTPIWSGPLPPAIIKLPHSGHFVPMIRACQEEQCGGWAESTNIEVARVDGQPRAWWLYGYIAPARRDRHQQNINTNE